jgi:hypothetical protein
LKQKNCRKIRRQTDQIPLDQLNGQRAEVGEETGDTAFGLAQIVRHSSIASMNLDQKMAYLGWCRLIAETEGLYKLNFVQMGVAVNMQKNHLNNPVEFYQYYHPLDSARTIIDRNDEIRMGLRVVRNMDVSTENCGRNIWRWPYRRLVIPCGT